MTQLQIGNNAPDFSLPGDNGTTLNLSDFKGQKVVVYFYPKDDTPGCTTQASEFSQHEKAFEAAGVKIIGISKDSCTKHDKFKTKHNLTISLASDENGTTCEDYGVWVEKNMYGKKYMGIERSTFLIDENGKIAEIWSKVKVPGHVEAVLNAAKANRKAA